VLAWHGGGRCGGELSILLNSWRHGFLFVRYGFGFASPLHGNLDSRGKQGQAANGSVRLSATISSYYICM
jgi:hypothetical protein